MNGSAINREAYELNRRVHTMVARWKDENGGRQPRYLFLSTDAYVILKNANAVDRLQMEYATYMGIEIAPVGVPGIYAGLGDWFQ